MPSNRNDNLPAIWAADGSELPISGTPTAGITYVKAAMTELEQTTGWPFATIVNSALFNEAVKRITTLLVALNDWGILPWHEGTSYGISARVMGSDGKIYKSTAAANVGNDPTSSPTKWADVTVETHAANHSNPHGVTTTQIGAETPSGAQAKVNTEAGLRALADATHAALHGTSAHGASTSATGSSIAARDPGGRLEGTDAVSGNDLVNYTQWQSGLGVGVGQTWQDVSASRTYSVNYQNTTGQPIQVSIGATLSTGSVQFKVGPTVGSMVQVAVFSGANTSNPMQAIIPAGHYYGISGACVINCWAELR